MEVDIWMEEGKSEWEVLHGDLEGVDTNLLFCF